MKSVLKSVLVVGAVCLAVPAFAKGKAKGHKKAAVKMHCMKDGNEMADAKSKKACKKAGGKWEKMAEAAPAEGAAPAGGEGAAPAGGTTP